MSQGHLEVQLLTTNPSCYRTFTALSVAYSPEGLKINHADGSKETIPLKDVHFVYTYSNH